MSRSRDLEGDLASEEPDDRICRFCLDAGDEPLFRVCACRGSQEWVHLGCLRQWQISVQTSVNNPIEVSAERRHIICNVCRTPFHGSEIPQRTELVAAMAGLRPEDLRPGLLIRYANMFPLLEVEDPAMRILFESKKAHFENSVYLLTSIEAGSAADGSEDSLYGVNLTRSTDDAWSIQNMPLADRTRGALTDKEIAIWRRTGIRVSLGIGGPVAPKKPCTAVLVSVVEPGGWAFGDMQPLSQRAAALAKGEGRNGRGGGRVEVLLRVFFGRARWSRTQLLGEIARGSWGVAVNPNVKADELRMLPEESDNLWQHIGESGRLIWAKQNPMRDDYERRSIRHSRSD